MKNNHTTQLVSELKKLAIDNKRPLWKRVASDLEKPTRQRRVVNLWKLDRFVSEGEVIVIPGKLLGDGSVSKKITVAAAGCSNEAKTKLEKSGSKVVTIAELMKAHPDGKNIKIIG